MTAQSPDQRGRGRMMRIFICWRHKALAQQLVNTAAFNCGSACKVSFKIGSLSGAVVVPTLAIILNGK